MKIRSRSGKIRELHKVYASQYSASAAGIYDDWSADYEEHMRGVAYTHPANEKLLSQAFAFRVI